MPPPGQLEPELPQGRPVCFLEGLDHALVMRPVQASGLGQDEPGHDLARLDDRRVTVAQPLDPAHRAQEEPPRLGLDLAPLVTRIGHCPVPSSG
jgi:hypothetical protein